MVGGGEGSSIGKGWKTTDETLGACARA